MVVIAVSLRFLLGRSGSGKTAMCLAEIRRKLQEDPRGKTIVYLVPEQMTFQCEYALIHTEGAGGMIRAQVFSFPRLAWRVLQETGGMNRYHVHDVGVQMMIRKIIEQRKQELKLFGRAADKSGFVEQLHEMIAECKRYCLTPDELRRRVEELESGPSRPGRRLLADKLSDVALVYAELERSLSGHYLDSEDYLRLLAEQIPRSCYLRDADVYIDGFHHFAPQEYIVIEQLLRHCRRVTVCLTVDRPYDGAMPDELDLFYLPAQTYRQLRELALANDVLLEEPVVLAENRRHQSGALAHLEAQFHRRPLPPYEAEDGAVCLYEAANRRAELEAVAREIIRLVRDEGARYRDIALVIRQTEAYRDLVKTVFFDFGIPYFMDEKEPMHHHPLIELVRAALEIISTNWRYEAVFRAVKTDLLFPLDGDLVMWREAADKLENYVLAYGMKGDKWTSGERWPYRRYRALDGLNVPQTDEERQFEDKLNEWRETLAAPLRRLERRLRRAKDGRGYCTALYLLLEELQIPKKLEQMSAQAEAEGRLVEARQHEQVWNAVIDLLDQYVEMLGAEPLSLAEFAKIIEAGLDRLEFSLVPPAIDQVIVAQLDRSRLIGVKYAFVIGANDGVIPARAKEDGLMAEIEREQLRELGVALAPGSREQLFYDPFFIYLALACPSERLYVTYPLADGEGKALMPSPLIKQLSELFPKVKVRLCGNDPFDAPEEKAEAFVTAPQATQTYLVSQLRAWKRNYGIDPLWWDVYNVFIARPEWNERVQRAVSALFYTNKAAPLKKQWSRRLYGKKIQASVSRMEQFQKCPYAHFISHGLRLKERSIFRLEAPDVGQLFHAAIKQIADRLREQHVDWRELSQPDCERLSDEAVERLAPLIQQQVLSSSSRYEYMKRKLKHVVARTTHVLSEHARASGFVPIGLELAFGPGGDLPPLRFQLRDGTVMELVGRIDRVDKAESSEGVFLRIIDYKSSAKTLDLTEVYYGLALQMLTYLDIVLTYAEQLVKQPALPAGVLYFHVHNPIVKAKQWLDDEAEMAKQLLEPFRMRGLLLADVEAIRLMDSQLEKGQRSLIVPVRLTSSGAIHSQSSVVSASDFDALRQHVRRLFADIGGQIADGIVSIAPYKLKSKTACDFCAFKSICQFDEALSGNEFRKLAPQTGEDVMKNITKGRGES